MKRIASFLFAGVLSLLIVINMAPVEAATTSSGLSIPPRKDLKIEPGKSVEDTMTISNLNRDVDLSLSVRVVDFTFTDNSGTPKLFLEQNAPQTTWSLKPFIELPEIVTVPAGKSATIKYKVSIPASQGAGSYYSAVLFGSGAGDGGNVNLSASGVTLAFVSVPGDVNEEMTLEKLGAYQANPNSAGGKFVYVAVDEPRQIGFRLKNNGNVFEAPAGSITLKPMFGKEIIIPEANPGQKLALIGQDRLFTSCIQPVEEEVEVAETTVERTNCDNPSLWPGRYTVNLEVFYGQNGNQTNEIVGTASFWYLPIWFLGLVGALLAYIGYTAWKIKRKINQKSQGNTPKRYRKR